MDNGEIINQSIANVDEFFHDVAHLLNNIKNELEKKYKCENMRNNAITIDNSSSIQYPEKWMPWVLYFSLKTKDRNDYIIVSVPLRDNENDFTTFDKIYLTIGKYRNIKMPSEAWWYNKSFLFENWVNDFRKVIDENYMTIDPAILTSENSVYAKERFDYAVIYKEDIFKWTGKINERLKEVIDHIDREMSGN